MSKSKEVTVSVHYPSYTTQYRFAGNAKGQTVIATICDRLTIFEPWFFGLYGYDNKETLTWLKLEKALSDQNFVCANGVYEFFWSIKFYPENWKAEVIQISTLKMMYEELRSKVMSEELYCDPAVAVNLAALHLQYLHGNNNMEITKEEVEKNMHLLIPSGLVERHDMTRGEWISIIEEMWQGYKNLVSNEALKDAMSALEELEMYGVRYYNIRNKRKTPLYLGIEPNGINIYKEDNKLIPKVGLVWSEIKFISYEDKKFTIKLLDKNSQDFVFYSDRIKENSILMDICIGNHQLYLARRKPDPEDVQSWKDKAKLCAAKEQEEQKAVVADKTAKFEKHKAAVLAEKAKAVADAQAAAAAAKSAEEKAEAERRARLAEEERRAKEAELAAEKARAEMTKEMEKEKKKQNEMTLKKVGNQLKQSRKTVTDLDKNQEEVIKSGNDKHKTLRAIRNGNTRARVDQFEAL